MLVYRARIAWRSSLFILTATAVTAGALFTSIQHKQPEVKVIVRLGSRELMVRPSSPQYSALVETVEAALRSCLPGRMLKLALFKTDLRQLYEEESSIEVIYPSARKVAISSMDTSDRRNVTLERILIPLTGRFANSATTVFYGVGGIGGGPFTTDIKFRDRLLELSASAP